MKIRLEGTQEELDSKREELIKALAKDKLDVEIRAKGQKIFGQKRPPYFKAQHEILEYWDKKFQKMLKDIKKDISEIIKDL
ncbi:hypothetical protein EBU95_19365 [bacterium]|nr:hypothetical protein [bacterium]